jgi:glycosyltransferase involved in cell wall biosynthesis
MRTRGEAISILARAKALIVPSLWFEGMPMVILEAWSKGVPVIGSRIGGISEMLRDGRGIAFDPGSPDALAQAVRKLAETPDWASQLAVSGSVEYSRKHLPTLGLSRLEAVYAGAIAAVAR